MSGQQAVEQAYRDEWSRLLALLVTRLRRFDLAEDSLQDAFASAARVWPAGGAPARPAAWLYTAAYRRALDRLRREDADARRLPLLLTDPTGPLPAAVVLPGPSEDSDIPDERLRLLFACCHPALRPDARAALMLRFVAGLTTAEIARLFLVSEPTMAARLTRAKAKMAVAGIPLRRPSAADLPARLDVVLKAIYLLFTEGYRATAGPALLRPRLADEAIRLAYLTGELLPGEPRTAALLALMLLQHARRDARVAADGSLVLLPDQDRTAWHHDEIARGLSLLAVLEAAPMPGEYHLQALIAAEHAKPPPTDWPRIAQLYAELERRTGSPVVRLNRAVAVAEAGAPDAALALVEAVQLPGNHLLPTVRAELLVRLDRPAEAADAFDQALTLARTEPERAHLQRRRAAVQLPRA
ncbi:MAG: sigma-70 family RNA polymerase sigma factor [Actinoplanes sp.]